MNKPNGNVGGRNELLEKIRELSFVKVELELYLDTHPECAVALDYYTRTVDALNAYTEEYENKYTPLCASGQGNGATWRWIDTPWPWQMGNGAKDMTEGRR